MAALSIGARGPEVASLQKRLHALGYEDVLPDGVFGPATQVAVGDLQHRHGLEATGRVGSSLAALISSPDVLAAPKQRPDDIAPDEVQGQMPFVTAALGAPDHAARRVAAAEGFMAFGPRFLYLLGQALQWARDSKADPATDADTAAGIARTEDAIADLEQVDEWFLEWLQGERFTERVDEPECRAIVATMVLDEMGLAGLTRVAVDAILALPHDHPRRDVDRARAALLAHLNRCRILRDHSTALATIRDLVSHRLLPPAETERLIREGERLLARIDDVSERRNFWVSVFGYHLGQAFEERDRLDSRSSRFEADGADEQPPSRRRMIRSRTRAERALAKMEALLGDLPEADRARVSAKNRYGLAALYGLDQPAKSVDMLRSVLDSQALDDDSMHDVARLEAKQRLLLGEWERACELLEPRVEAFERRYLAAVDSSDIDETGDEYFEILHTLAWANVAADRWDRVVQFLGRGRGIRLRHRAALRSTPEGERVLALERRLHALERGVPVESGEARRERSQDWIGASLSERTAALEEYRRARQQAAVTLAHPDTRALGAALHPGEAVAILGLSYRGLLIAVVCAGDSEPSGRFRFEQWPESRVIDLMVGRELDGWLMALGGRIDPIDVRAPLEQVLREMNRAIGSPLGKFARERGITHLTIVPDPWLDFVPLWALRGLAGVDIAIASSLAQFVGERDNTPVAARRALLVADPTEDLPAALAESSTVAARLQSRGLQVERLDRALATVGTALDAVRASDLLHFAGHGRSVLSEPLRSALELHPDWAHAPVASAQALVALFKAGDVAWEQIYDEIREATVAGAGHLRELRRGDGSPVERWLDYADDRTLWSFGEDAEVVADLWTAGAMTIATPFASTRLAFLSACSSGGASTPSNEGASGLAAALQLAGVQAVISTRWEIDDAVAVLFADLFYEGLARADGTASVARVLRQAAVGLRRMSRDRAARRIDAIVARLRRRARADRAAGARSGFAQARRKAVRTPVLLGVLHCVRRREAPGGAEQQVVGTAEVVSARRGFAADRRCSSAHRLVRCRRQWSARTPSAAFHPSSSSRSAPRPFRRGSARAHPIGCARRRAARCLRRRSPHSRRRRAPTQP